MQNLPFDRLVSYVAGELTDAEASDVESYLARTPKVKGEVELVRTVIETMRMDDTTIPPRELVQRAAELLTLPSRPGALLEQASRLLRRAECTVATLLYDSRAEPALSGFRSGAWLDNAPRHLIYASPIGEIDLRIESSAGSEEACRVTGQVDLDEPERNGATTVTVIDRVSQAILGQATPDDGGLFTLDVQRGAYDMQFDTGDRSILLEDVQVA